MHQAPARHGLLLKAYVRSPPGLFSGNHNTCPLCVQLGHQPVGHLGRETLERMPIFKPIVKHGGKSSELRYQRGSLYRGLRMQYAGVCNRREPLAIHNASGKSAVAQQNRKPSVVMNCRAVQAEAAPLT